MKEPINIQQLKVKVLKMFKTCGLIWVASSMLLSHRPLFSETCCPCPPSCEDVYSTDVGGCGYQTCRRCPILAPAVALAVVALTGIIAIALQTDHGHLHAHHGHHHHRNR